MESQTFTSWNQMSSWLSQLEGHTTGYSILSATIGSTPAALRAG